MISHLRPTLRTFCILVVVSLVCLPMVAQRGGSGGGGGGGKGGGPGTGGFTGPVASPNGSPSYGGSYTPNPWPVEVATCTDTWACPLSTNRPMPATPTKDDPTCFLTPVAGIHSPTVSVTRLEVPRKATQEYEKACSGVQHQHFPEAEKHLQKAVQLYPDYAAAWVLLGQVQEMRHKTADATQSCSRARTIDPGYAPSYLCLAYLVSLGQQWEQLEQVTGSLLRLHPLNASNAYYYNALAYLHLNNLAAAEMSALRGVADNKDHHQPQLHLVLAQVYEKEGDRSSQIAQLREYLKRDPHGNDVAAVNNVLKQMGRL